MKTRLVILLLCACFHFSCSEFLNLKPDNQQVVYTMEDVKVSMSAYLRAMCSPDQYTLQYNTDWLSFPFSKRPCANFVMYSDDIVMTKAVDNAYSRIYEDNYWEDLNWEGRTFAETFWKCAYLNIGYLNNVLHDLENADDKYEDMDEYEQISGEARVFRAYYVFKLLQLFAPYKDNELGIPVNFDFEKVEGEGRMSQSEVYDLIIRELNDVLEYKAVAENWNGLYSPDVIKAFLAEVYWFKAQSGAAEDTDWENAAKYSGELMERYQPISTTEGYLEVFEAERTAPGSFVKNSTRALVLFSMYSNLYSFWGRPNASAHQAPNPELLAMFEEGDIRFDAFFLNLGSDEQPSYCVNKIVYDEDLVVLFRSDEMWLINAEANLHLNPERAREVFMHYATAKNPSYTLQGDLQEEIMKERRKEFCFEMDFRWLDMKRFGMEISREGLDVDGENVKVYTLEKDDYRYAWPIPTAAELDWNDKLEQNPGWEF